MHNTVNYGSQKFQSATPSANACGSAPSLQTNGGLAAATAVDIEIYGDCMVVAVDALAADGQFTKAVAAASSVAAYLQRAGSVSADQFITQAGNIACTAYDIALDNARNTTVYNMNILYGLIKPIMFWETIVQKLGAACTAIPADEYQTVIHSKIGEAMEYYLQEKPNIIYTSSSNYAAAKTEAEDSSRTKNEVLALNPPAALSNTITSEITQRSQPGLLDAMLQAPWDRCRNTANYDELIYLMTAMGSPDAVKTAAQYCGTVLNAEAKNSSGTVTDQLAQPLGGVSAGVNHTSGSESLTIAIDGTTIYTLDVGEGEINSAAYTTLQIHFVHA